MFYDTLIMPLIVRGAGVPNVKRADIWHTYIRYPIDRAVKHTYDYDYVDYVNRWNEDSHRSCAQMIGTQQREASHHASTRIF